MEFRDHNIIHYADSRRTDPVWNEKPYRLSVRAGCRDTESLVAVTLFDSRPH
jgi:hypothetical protein